MFGAIGLVVILAFGASLADGYEPAEILTSILLVIWLSLVWSEFRERRNR